MYPDCVGLEQSETCVDCNSREECREARRLATTMIKVPLGVLLFVKGNMETAIIQSYNKRGLYLISDLLESAVDLLSDNVKFYKYMIPDKKPDPRQFLDYVI